MGYTHFMRQMLSSRLSVEEILGTGHTNSDGARGLWKLAKFFVEEVVG